MKIQRILNLSDFQDTGQSDQTSIKAKSNLALVSNNETSTISSSVVSVIQKLHNYLTNAIGYTTEFFAPLASTIMGVGSQLVAIATKFKDGAISAWSKDDCTVSITIDKDVVNEVFTVVEDNGGLTVLTNLNSALADASCMTTLLQVGHDGVYMERILDDGSIDANIKDSDYLIRITDSSDTTDTITINGLVLNSFKPWDPGNLKDAYENLAGIPLYNFVKEGLANLTSLEVLKETVSECVSSLNNGTSFNYSTIVSWVQGKVSTFTDIKNTVGDIMDSINSSTDVTQIIMAVKSKLSSLTTGVATSATIEFSSNEDYTVGSIGSGILGGVATALSTIATVIGTAIGGLFGALTSLAGLAIRGVSKLMSLIPTYDQSTLIGTNSMYTIDTCEGGYCQGATILPSAVTSAIDSAYPGVMVETPWFIIFQTSNGAEIQLKPTMRSCFGLFTKELITFGTDGKTMTLHACDQQTLYKAITYNSESTSDPLLYGQTTDSDASARAALCCSLVWLIYTLFEPGYYSGQSSVTFSADNGDVWSYMSLFCYNVMNKMYYQNASGTWYPKPFKASDWDAFGWEQFTGSNIGSGEGMYLYYLTKWLLNKNSNPWYQTDLPSGAYSAASVMSVVRNSTGLFFTNATATGAVSGPCPLIITPLPKYKIPSFSRNDFWSSYILAILAMTVTSIAAVAVAFKVRKIIRKHNAWYAGRAESAWEAYYEDPTTENFKEYYSAVRDNNFFTKLTGGTTLSYCDYWGETGEEEADNNLKNAALDVISTDMGDEFAEIKSLLR